MADPTIQTFCCHHNNRSDLAIVIMQEFDTDAYNTVCLLSSSLGIMGAVYQVLPRQEIPSRGRQIIVWLAFADLLASLGVFLRSILWLNNKTVMPVDETSSIAFCAFFSAWTEYFYMVTWIWTLIYAIDMKLLLSEKPGHPFLYHSVAWICPALLTSIGLGILYIPDAKCHDLTSVTSAIYRILPNYFVTYAVLATVMIVNPILYVLSTYDLRNLVTGCMGQLTGRERKIVYSVKLKFALTNMVYYICWIPNLINGILLWTLWFKLPVKIILTVWYMMAVTNPLQAFFNALVYKKWGRKEKFRLNWLCCSRGSSDGSYAENLYSQVNETSSLLHSQYRMTPRPSINRSSSL